MPNTIERDMKNSNRDSMILDEPTTLKVAIEIIIEII
jgi:hypothetical protein